MRSATALLRQVGRAEGISRRAKLRHSQSPLGNEDESAERCTSRAGHNMTGPSQSAEVCLVIGAGDGVGGAVAKAFAAAGMTVAVTRRARNLDQLQRLAAEIARSGGTAMAYGVDARSEGEMVALFD